METLKEIGLEIDEILRSPEINDSQKVSFVYSLVKTEMTPKNFIPEELFKKAYFRSKETELSLKEIRDFIPLCYVAEKEKYPRFSPIRVFRHLSGFISEDPTVFSKEQRKRMRAYILSKIIK